ncbi:MAG: ComF family protein [Candidatus Liptonbacteria bacterium]|nr:ComF family protein [Candidatus Liptonbacteria bacterium]
MLEPLLDLFFPPRCLSCNTAISSAKDALCLSCFSSISLEQTLRCGECLARIPEEKRICHKSFPYILGAASHYSDPHIRALIQGLKFRHAHAAAEVLGSLLAKYLQNVPLQLSAFTILPIPLSSKRERERGYNQSALLARSLQTHIQIPILENVLVRIKHSDPQSQLEKWELRRENVREAFRVINPDLLPKSKILLLDDVTTSGATFFEAAKVLRENGARQILAIAAAKA